jgi:homopolymeric O-antigen transport system ATP-binding protein
MSALAIHCEGISKRYRLGERQRYRALRDTLTETFLAPYRWVRRRSRAQAPGDKGGPGFVWALKDVSLEIGHGEVLGIIGRNGAGKSTLLRILSRITKPTVGCAEIYGRTGSLLEVGTGFHPELTGRENIYLNGAILGMRRREIERRFDEIVGFSECGRFLDTPVKHYSTGMYMRLAFAVAAHLDTEILLVDEVLAVGDAPFQRKCLAKASDAARGGRTVVFVSHNMVAVNSLCSRAICLHEGKVVASGQAQQVTSQYMRNWVARTTEVAYADLQGAPGNEGLRLRRASVRILNGTPDDQITMHTPFVVEFEYQKLTDEETLELAADLLDQHGVHILHSWWPSERPVRPGLYRSSFVVPGGLLNKGMHRVRFFGAVGACALPKVEDLLVFDVQDPGGAPGQYLGEWPGAVRPYLEWKTERLASWSPEGGSHVVTAGDLDLIGRGE